MGPVVVVWLARPSNHPGDFLYMPAGVEGEGLQLGGGVPAPCGSPGILTAHAACDLEGHVAAAVEPCGEALAVGLGPVR